jgi:hypothetical protein
MNLDVIQPGLWAVNGLAVAQVHFTHNARFEKPLCTGRNLAKLIPSVRARA